MSEWRGLHNPDWHDSVGVRAWCRCGTWCSEDAECDCCELVELRAEFERLTARAEAAEAERDALRAERVAGIRVGRAILRAMGEALPPHWDHDEGDSCMGGADA